MRAGGVACYIHRSLISKILFMSKISDITETEFLVLEISSSTAPGASKLLLAVVYRHEEGHVLTEFFNVTDELSQSYKNIIILADFNVNVLNFHALIYTLRILRVLSRGSAPWITADTKKLGKEREMSYTSVRGVSAMLNYLLSIAPSFTH